MSAQASEERRERETGSELSREATVTPRKNSQDATGAKALAEYVMCQTPSTALPQSPPLRSDLSSPFTMAAPPKVCNEMLIDQLGLQGFLQSVLEQGESHTALTLAENAIGDDGARIVRETLAGSQHLRRLTLLRGGLGAAGLCEVGAMIEEMPKLETLVVGGCSIGSEPFPNLFCQGIAKAPALRQLHVDHSGLTASTLPPLCAVLRGEDCQQPAFLERLNLSHNQLGAEGAQLVIRSLANNQVLRKLELTANGIGPRGGMHVADDFAKIPNAGLRTLIIDRNEMGFRGCSALARNWTQHVGPLLDILSMRDNGLTWPNCDELCSVLGKPAAEKMFFGDGSREVWITIPKRPATMVHSTYNGRHPYNVFWHD